MVKLHIKQGNESQFLFDTTVATKVDDLLKDLVFIHNGRLKINRLCFEIEELSKHGVYLPLEMQGLSSEQVIDLKLYDEWAEMNLSSDKYTENIDPIGRRNGKAPVEKMAEILTKTTAEAKAKVSKKLVESDMCLTSTNVQDALDILRGAIMIAYPMGLPKYEPIQQELDDKEDLSGAQAGQDILDESLTDLWWAGKQLERSKVLSDYIGKNEKSKLVVKLQMRGRGAPSREPVLTETEHKMLMLDEYRRQEELKKLDEDEDDSYYDAAWADNKKLQKTFQGLNNIRFGFR